MKLASFIRSQTLAALFLAAFSMPATAEKVLIAIAANFAGAAEKIAEDFTRETGYEALITTGSTGKLYSQITEGAPFDILLSADTKTPSRLETESLAIPGSVFTYAIGKLTLWSADPALIGPDPKTALTDQSLRFIAIANPDLAPYGQAAREVLQSIDLWDSLQSRVVMGQNIGQTFGLIQSGAAELGFIARSALDAPDADFGGSRWDVPDDLFMPLRQDAALLKAGVDNPAAKAFLDYLSGPEARAIIIQFGYGVPE
jgi:molybdate transport system substrate-binding protein